MKEKIALFKELKGDTLTVREKNLINRFENGSLTKSDERSLHRLLENTTDETVAYMKVKEAMEAIASLEKLRVEATESKISDFSSWIGYENPDLSAIWEVEKQHRETVSQYKNLARIIAEFRRDTKMVSFLNAMDPK